MAARKMSAREARASFGHLLSSVYYTKEPVIIEKKGRPFAVVISPEEYEAIQKERERARTVVDRVRERNADKNPDEVLSDVTEVVEDVRKARYERRKRQTVEEVKQKVLPILARYGASRAGLFGSAVRGEMKEDSDFDVVVELGPGLSLLDLVRINRELEEALGRKVDLVEYDAIKPRIKERILAEEVRIL